MHLNVLRFPLARVQAHTIRTETGARRLHTHHGLDLSRISSRRVGARICSRAFQKSICNLIRRIMPLFFPFDEYNAGALSMGASYIREGQVGGAKAFAPLTICDRSVEKEPSSVNLGPIACDHGFFCTLIARSRQPIITSDKKGCHHGGRQKITTKWNDNSANFV